MLIASPTTSAAASVHVQHHDGMAVLWMDRPPVNALGHSLRRDLFHGLVIALGDPQIQAVAITGKGPFFCGGTDLGQLVTPEAFRPPLPSDLHALISGSRKPVVAAIQGAALGGGLELALACHLRVMHERGRLGLPEILLGLVPGGGGTQRLPRLIGAKAALDMILHGTSVDASRALQTGLVDEVCDGDVIPAARAILAEKTSKQGALSTQRRLAFGGDADFEAALANIDPEAPNRVAQRAAIECVRLSCSVDLETGLFLEREAFRQLMDGAEAKALRDKRLTRRRSAHFKM